MTQPVLVVGGGPAGSAAAITLAKRGIDVLLFEQVAGTGNKLTETLYPGAEALLRTFGVEEVKKKAASVRYVGRDGKTELTLFFGGSVGVIDRNQLDDDLRFTAAATGVELVLARVDSIDVNAEQAVVQARGETFHGSYLIDASGKNPISAAEQPPVLMGGVLDNRFNAFSHYVHPTGFGLDTQTIVALNDGFAYVLPVHRDRICIGITSYARTGSNSIEAAYASHLSECNLLRALIDGAQRVLPVIPAKNRPVTNPAISGGRTIRVGDALGFRDPFLWDGVSFALETGRAAGAYCADAISTGTADPERLSQVVSSLDRAIRQRTARYYDGLAAQFNAVMTIDPHVSPALLSSLFALTGRTNASGFADLRRGLSERRAAS